MDQSKDKERYFRKEKTFEEPNDYAKLYIPCYPLFSQKMWRVKLAEELASNQTKNPAAVSLARRQARQRVYNDHENRVKEWNRRKEIGCEKKMTYFPHLFGIQSPDYCIVQAKELCPPTPEKVNPEVLRPEEKVNTEVPRSEEPPKLHVYLKITLPEKNPPCKPRQAPKAPERIYVSDSSDED